MRLTAMPYTLITVVTPAMPTRRGGLSVRDSRVHSPPSAPPAHTYPGSLRRSRRVLVPFAVFVICGCCAWEYTDDGAGRQWYFGAGVLHVPPGSKVPKV